MILTGGPWPGKTSHPQRARIAGDPPPGGRRFHRIRQKHRQDWLDEEFRQGYMVASVEEGLAGQIRAMRKDRRLTQSQLAEKLNTTQSGVSRLEDPEYGI